MNPMTLLMLVSVIGASALFIALAIFLVLILRQLDPTGGTSTSYLAKIRLGVRAIEIETGHLAPEVTKLNGGLSAVRDGLRVIDDNLGGVIAAVQKQERR